MECYRWNEPSMPSQGKKTYMPCYTNVLHRSPFFNAIAFFREPSRHPIVCRARCQVTWWKASWALNRIRAELPMTQSKRVWTTISTSRNQRKKGIHDDTCAIYIYYTYIHIHRATTMGKKHKIVENWGDYRSGLVLKYHVSCSHIHWLWLMVGNINEKKKKNTWLIGMPIMQCENPQYIGPFNSSINRGFEQRNTLPIVLAEWQWSWHHGQALQSWRPKRCDIPPHWMRSICLRSSLSGAEHWSQHFFLCTGEHIKNTVAVKICKAKRRAKQCLLPSEKISKVE